MNKTEINFTLSVIFGKYIVKESQLTQKAHDEMLKILLKIHDTQFHTPT